MANARPAEEMTVQTKRVLDARWGACIVLVSSFLFIAVTRARTSHEPVEGDQAIYSVIGHELLKGRSLYTDLWDHKPPAIHATYALGELVAGYGPHQLYVLHLAASTLTLVGLFRAGTLLGGPRAGLYSGVVWALGSVFPRWEGFQPNTEVFLNVILVWSFWMICRLDRAPRWWLACAFGAAIGVGSLYKQVVIAPAAMLGITYILRSGPKLKDRWAAIGYMLAAAGVSAVAWVVCVAWFWSQGNLADFYDAVFIYNRYYTGNVALNLVRARHFKFKSYLLAVALPCLLAPFAGPGLTRAQKNGWFFLAAYAAGCFIAQALPGRRFEHYSEYWMPVYALAGGAMLAGLCSGLLERPRLGRWGLLAMVFAPLAIRYVQPNEFASSHWLVHEPGGQEYLFRHSSRAAGLALNHLLMPGERMYALGTPGQSAPLYYYTHQSPPSGLIFDFPLRPGRPLAASLEERVIRDLERGPPDLIVSATTSFLGAVDGKPVDWGQRLSDWVRQRYSPQGSDPTNRYLLFARRGSAIERRLAQGDRS